MKIDENIEKLNDVLEILRNTCSKPYFSQPFKNNLQSCCYEIEKVITDFEDIKTDFEDIKERLTGNTNDKEI